ncbi:MAG: hypothetical protein H7228_08985 [Polaromonas sp.]|nr:hypothetical protein [Polaromonas sp.]
MQLPDGLHWRICPDHFPKQQKTTRHLAGITGLFDRLQVALDYAPKGQRWGHDGGSFRQWRRGHSFTAIQATGTRLNEFDI